MELSLARILITSTRHYSSGTHTYIREVMGTVASVDEAIRPWGKYRQTIENRKYSTAPAQAEYRNIYIIQSRNPVIRETKCLPPGPEVYLYLLNPLLMVSLTLRQCRYVYTTRLPDMFLITKF